MAIYRLATFNAALSRPTAGQLADDLATPKHPQIQRVAEIIQRVRPDILALQEFDHGEAAPVVADFQRHYLALSQNGAMPIHFPYVFAAPSNTGVSAGRVFAADAPADGPPNVFGFGAFPGQFGFVVLSRFPMDAAAIRQFRRFRWRDLPGVQPPLNPDGQPYYRPEAWEILRLSSKNHVDIPIHTPSGTLYVVVAHPTPPAFDGPERRNQQRNRDEIRLLADYIAADAARHAYLVDDDGQVGGVRGSQFAVLGDLNADPYDGDAAPGAIEQLLQHPRLHAATTVGHQVPRSAGGADYPQLVPAKNADHRGDPACDTAAFSSVGPAPGALRMDYVLPSAALVVQGSGVFWPGVDDSLGYLVAQPRAADDGRGPWDHVGASSDHRLVWVDVAF